MVLLQDRLCAQCYVEESQDFLKILKNSSHYDEKSSGGGKWGGGTAPFMMSSQLGTPFSLRSVPPRHDPEALFYLF